MAADAHNASTAGNGDLDAISQTIQRVNVGLLTVVTLSSGWLFLTGIYLPGGVTINTISFRSGDTALVSGTHQWFCIYDLGLAKQCVTNNDTSTAWGANTTKTLTVPGGYVGPASALYYVGICVVATTCPTLATSSGVVQNIMSIPPVRVGLSTTGLTNPASAPSTAAAVSYTGYVPLAWVA